MSNVRIEINDAGVQELLHEIGSTVCAELAEGIASRCGPGYSSDTFNAGSRTIASAFADSEEAMAESMELDSPLLNNLYAN